MNAFFDANVFLSFFEFGKDDIETMRRVVRLIDEGELRIMKNDQLVREIERNRHARIQRPFKDIKQHRFNLAYPNFIKNIDKYDEILSQLRKVNCTHRAILAAAEAKIKERTLDADILIKEILDRSIAINITEEVLFEARLRAERGDLPRKAGDSLGDAIHWECLLRQPSGFLCIVSMDGDFQSPLYPGQIHDCLHQEWANSHKYHKLEFFVTLTDFLRQKFPEFDLNTEDQKNAVIERLRSSPSFAHTHEIVSELIAFGNFTAAQSKRLCEILIENSQVRWIATDSDIQELYDIVWKKVWLYTSDDVIEEVGRILEWPEDKTMVPF